VAVAASGDIVVDVSSSEVTMYWRPGCGFCAALKSRFERAELAYTAVNIWEDPEAAAFVRSVANGNEVVPTVTVGSTAAVNPSLEDVLDMIAAESSI
jgi:mycoredoxin